MTEREVYDRFIAAIHRAGGQRAYARQVDLTPSYINDIVHGRRALSDVILKSVGIERVVTTTVEYREIR